MHLTSKQRELLTTIAKANPDGSPTDLNEILERLSYAPTKESVQFSIRALIAHNIIEKLGSENRRGRRRVLIGATELGKQLAAPSKIGSFISSEEQDQALEELSGVFE
jgi:DNA-binding MarR family transcriptional regulator